ncbi:uncharacterized protein LOC143210226 [Lasioglossum baleicum]|uniref:uncharacterized protein LOC143210226 n=1 Tax=Lasioglossum baleicum TaxID=434251 RepID=UPI003FCE1E8C
MKCFVAIVLFALFAIAFAEEKPVVQAEVADSAAPVAAPDAPRDKRGVLLSYAAAPLAYSPYTAPIAYSSAYSLPYAYRAAAYPSYYPSYYSSYIYG